jgi:2,3-dihydroxybenzoate decarboxylase
MNYQRIATEEAFATAELFELYRQMLAGRTLQDPGFLSLWGFYLQSPSARATRIIERLQDIGARRIADMDSTGIAMHILSLTSPGVQHGLQAWRRSPPRTRRKPPRSWNGEFARSD